MKNNNFPVLFYAALTTSISASFLLTGCGGNDQKAELPATISGDNSKIAYDLVEKASDSSVHWLTPNLLVMPKSNQAVVYQLISTGLNKVVSDKPNQDFDAMMLSNTSFPPELADKFPHLADFQAYSVDISPSKAKALLKQQLLVIALDKRHETKKVSFVQTGAVIDELFTKGSNDANEVSDLGSTIITKNGDESVSFKLWAPTAQQVDVLVFNKDLSAQTATLPMVEDIESGVWSITNNAVSNGDFYQYQVTVYHPLTKKVETLITTDPYSLSLSINSKHSQVVDLDDASTQPKNWKNHSVPTVKNVEDNIFYETHIRDFSANDNALSNIDYRGKYKAFTEQKSYGIKHLKALKQAGLNNIHLLPTFDIGTVDEDTNKVVNLQDTIGEIKARVCSVTPDISVCSDKLKDNQTLQSLLESFDPSGVEAQKVISELRWVDNYNWGYDPFHYTVPEGSYAVNPQGKSRLIEFREMVQSIHSMGFRVIMDVVYNHTHQSGLETNSVLDKIVPNYYHRLDPISGAIEQSTCCDNTATERVMMAKLMTDSLVTWSRDYKIDGFRFDLMGHQPKSAMLAAREAVRKIDSDTYFYGEGWNFGEVANNKQFTQASQLELGGTEIGTYTDRLRDAVRGGGNNTRDSQGLGNGLLTLPNERQMKDKTSPYSNLTDYNLRLNQARIGLAGNLANFPLGSVNGKQVLGKDVPYGDQPTGYALDPADTINYVSKHDNQTLWDNSQYRIAFDVSTDDRVRMHLQSLAFSLYAQGIPFIHMGSEFMRSKSFLRDSYDYSDWFNRVDFSQQNNFYNVGLPPAEKDKGNWPLIKQVMAGHEGRDVVNAAQIQFSSNVFKEMLAIRMSSPLFRLTTEKEIIDKVSFLNSVNALEDASKATRGLLVMKIDDSIGETVDTNYRGVIVIYNTSNDVQSFDYKHEMTPDSPKGYQLHPIHNSGVDDVVKQSKVTTSGFIVPPLSTVVFVQVRK